MNQVKGGCERGDEAFDFSLDFRAVLMKFIDVVETLAELKRSIEEFKAAVKTYRSGGGKSLLQDFASRVYKAFERVAYDYASNEDLCANIEKSELYKMLIAYYKWLDNKSSGYDEE